MVSDFKGLGLGRGGLGLEWPGLGLVSVSDDEVSVSDDKAETPSLVLVCELIYWNRVNIQLTKDTNFMTIRPLCLPEIS